MVQLHFFLLLLVKCTSFDILWFMLTDICTHIPIHRDLDPVQTFEMWNEVWPKPTAVQCLCDKVKHFGFIKTFLCNDAYLKLQFAFSTVVAQLSVLWVEKHYRYYLQCVFLSQKNCSALIDIKVELKCFCCMCPCRGWYEVMHITDIWHFIHPSQQNSFSRNSVG